MSVTNSYPLQGYKGRQSEKLFSRLTARLPLFALLGAFFFLTDGPARSQTSQYEFHDSHFRLANNIQEGPDIHDFLKMMRRHAGRVAIFGVPLQQEWSYRVDADLAPTYYLHRKLWLAAS